MEYATRPRRPESASIAFTVPTALATLAFSATFALYGAFWNIGVLSFTSSTVILTVAVASFPPLSVALTVKV